MPHKHAEIFPKITHAVLEGANTEGEPLYSSYDEGPLSSIANASPRLVATYRLVSVRLLVKRARVEVVKLPKRRRKK